MASIMSDKPSFTDEEALAFHAEPKPGKLEITPTKPMATQRDLSLAYSPAVADGLITVGPMLPVAAMPIHVVASSITARGRLDMTALAVMDAQAGEWRRSLAKDDA